MWRDMVGVVGVPVQLNSRHLTDVAGSFVFAAKSGSHCEKQELCARQTGNGRSVYTN